MAVDSAGPGEVGQREMSPRLALEGEASGLLRRSLTRRFRVVTCVTTGLGRVSRWSSGWVVARVSSFEWRRRGSFGWSDAGRAGTLGMATMISADGQAAVAASVVARLSKIPSGELERTGSTPRSSHGLAGS